MIPRKSRDSRLELSSNQLLHPAVERIMDWALRRVTPDRIIQYPRFASPVDRIGAHFGIPASELILTPGSDSALRLICRDFARSGPSPRLLLLHHPNYYALEQEASCLGIEVKRITWASIADQGRELLDAARSSSNALIALSVPNGPIGGCIPSQQLDELLDIARERNHFVTIDSCYQAFHGQIGENLRRRDEHVLIVQSLSKSHGLAGARIGLLCGKSPWIDRLSTHWLEHAVSSPTLELACAVLERGADFEDIWEEIKASREEAARTLERAGYPPLPSGGNFLSFRVGTQARADALLDRMSGRGYRVKGLGEINGYQGYVRITIGDRATTRSVLDDLLPVLDETSDLG
jgi:histidinol-phosphate aminotransferase